MYQVGQKVVYGIHGVCRIIDREDKRVDRKSIPYWVLEPLHQPGTRFYIPAEKEAALSKIRPLLEKQRLQELLNGDGLPELWIPEENQRRLLYRQIVNGVDFPSVLGMVVALQRHRQRQEAAGRKLHMSDENFLRDGRRILESELSEVLQIPAAEVLAYLFHEQKEASR